MKGDINQMGDGLYADLWSPDSVITPHFQKTYQLNRKKQTFLGVVIHSESSDVIENLIDSPICSEFWETVTELDSADKINPFSIPNELIVLPNLRKSFNWPIRNIPFVPR